MSDKQKTFENTKLKIDEIVQRLNASTACFSGLRSQKLPWGSHETDERCLAMKKKLRGIVEDAVQNGYKTFLCGMAIGFDMICAETVLELKKTYSDLKLIGALPCKDQDKFWSSENKKRYQVLLRQLDGIRCVYNHYIGPECMLERDEYMIKKSSLLIALFNGKKGGTMKTISYAKRQGIKIIVIEP